MAHNHIHIDPALPLVRQADKGHNRWHPDIAPAVRIASGSSVEMETLDGLDGQIKSRTTAADLAGIEMGRVHPLTGPVHVDGAEPGDLPARGKAAPLEAPFAEAELRDEAGRIEREGGRVGVLAPCSISDSHIASRTQLAIPIVPADALVIGKWIIVPSLAAFRRQHYVSDVCRIVA